MSDDACRIDVWLWRARFFKTRGLACRFVEEGRLRLTRFSNETRVEKPAQSVKPGDTLVFALAGRVTAIRVANLGERRGPPAEARALYDFLDAAPSPQENSSSATRSSVDKPRPPLENSGAFLSVRPRRRCKSFE